MSRPLPNDIANLRYQHAYPRDRIPMLHRYVVTIFFQGIGSSRAQVAKYTGQEGALVPWKGSRVYVDNAPGLLTEVYPYKELDEIGYGFSCNPLHLATLFATFIKNFAYGMRGAPAYYIRPEFAEVAGPGNVALHLATTRECMADNPDKKLVLFGTSRGAATTFISLTKMNEEELDRIAFVVLEGMPDSVDGVLDARAPFPWLAKKLFYSFSAHYADDPSPLDVADEYPMSVHTLFVTSDADTRVPPECTERVISALQDRGMEPDVLRLKNASHSSYPTHNPEDTKAYTVQMLKLYDKHFPLY